MAFVMTTREIPSNIPFNTAYGAVNYNGVIYINTPTAIYVYYPTNNSYELLYSKTFNTSPKCVIINDNIYMGRYEGRVFTLYCYNITARTFLSVGSFSWTTSYGGRTVQADCIYLYNNTIIGFAVFYNNTYSALRVSFSYSNNNLTGEALFGSSNDCASGQVLNRYFIKYTTYSDYNTQELKTGSLPTTYTQRSFTEIITSPVNFGNHASFTFGGLDYVLHGNTITTFNPDTNIFTDLDVQIPFTVSGKYAVKIDNDIYVFGSTSVFIISFVDYNLRYAFTNNDGSVMYKDLTEMSPITSLRFNYSGGSSVGYIVTTLSGVSEGQFNIEIPEGKTLLGFSTTPKPQRASYPVNTLIESYIDVDTTFYAVFLTYRPPSTVFNIELYNNSSEVNRVDKGNYLSPVGTLLGALREECSMLTPSIVYQSSDVPTFNYVYIPIFNRYYFVTSLSSVSKNVWRMELNCDVLMTYKNEILLLQGVIGRQEIDFNPLLVDNELPTQNNPIVEVIDIPSDAFNTQTSDAGHNFLLTVIGA